MNHKARLGEKLGTFISYAEPEEPWAVKRRSYAQWVRNSVILGVLKGAGYERKIEDTRLYGSGTKEHDLYAFPPVQDPAQAQELGKAIAYALGRARQTYPDGEPLLPEETDIFLPVSSEADQ